MSADEKDQVRDALDEYSTELWTNKMSALPSDKKRSETFLKWYITRVHNFIEAPFVDEDALDDHIVDGAHDLEADFLYRDPEERIVLVFQSRWRKRDVNEAAKDIAYFADVLDRLKDPTWIESANEGVRAIAKKIDWESDKFDLRYLTLGRFSGNAAVAKENATAKVKDSSHDAVISFLGEPELNQKHRTSIAQHEPLPGSQLLYVKQAVKVGESWITVVSGAQIKQLYTSGNRDQLFSQNVRIHLGATKINKGIAKTIDESPEDFYYYNNGISCLVTTIERDAAEEHKFKLQGLQVINGAQTVRSVGDHHNDANLQKVRVLMRITPRTLNPANPAFVENIIRFNNTQNAIKEQDFISNDPVQVALVKQFDYTRLAKKVKYHPKRGPRLSTKYFNIEVVEFAQRVLSFVASPTAYRGSIPTLMTREKEHYKIVFGDGSKVYVKMPDAEFRYRSGVWWLSEELDSLRGKEKKNDKYLGSLDSLLLLLFVAHGLLERAYGPDHRKILEKHYQGSWRISGTDKHERMFARLYELSRDVLAEDFADQKSSQPLFKPTEWRRSDATIERVGRIARLRAGLDALAREYPLQTLI